MEESKKSKFDTMGTSASRGFRNSSGDTGSKVGKLVKKGHAKSVDPAKSNPAPKSRNNLKGNSTAKYGGIKTSMPSYTSPEAGATQGNGRLFQSAVRRQSPNFESGISSQN
jgi:hypothetical protein